MAFLRRMPVLFLKFFWLSCFFAIDRPKNHSRPCPETWAKAGNFYQDPPLSNLIKAPTAAFFKQ